MGNIKVASTVNLRAPTSLSWRYLCSINLAMESKWTQRGTERGQRVIERITDDIARPPGIGESLFTFCSHNICQEPITAYAHHYLMKVIK